MTGTLRPRFKEDLVQWVQEERVVNSIEWIGRIGGITRVVEGEEEGIGITEEGITGITGVDTVEVTGEIEEETVGIEGIGEIEETAIGITNVNVTTFVNNDENAKSNKHNKPQQWQSSRFRKLTV